MYKIPLYIAGIPNGLSINSVIAIIDAIQIFRYNIVRNNVPL